MTIEEQQKRWKACGSCGAAFSGTGLHSRRGPSSSRQSVCPRQRSRCSFRAL